jgi:hypothetical protein
MEFSNPKAPVFARSTALLALESFQAIRIGVVGRRNVAVQ